MYRISKKKGFEIPNEEFIKTVKTWHQLYFFYYICLFIILATNFYLIFRLVQYLRKRLKKKRKN